MFLSLHYRCLVRLSFHDRCVEISPICDVYLTSRVSLQKIRCHETRRINPSAQDHELLYYFPFASIVSRRSKLYISSPSNFLLFLFLFPFSLSRSSLSPIARRRPTIGVPMPTLSETLRTGPYPPPPRYPREVLQPLPQHRSGIQREIYRFF